MPIFASVSVAGWVATITRVRVTLQGRLLVPFQIGSYQQARMDAIEGQADLIYRNGTFFLAVTIDRPEPPAKKTEGTLGVDLGIVNLATDSKGAWGALLP
jgi:putative transposase